MNSTPLEHASTTALAPPREQTHSRLLESAIGVTGLMALGTTFSLLAIPDRIALGAVALPAMCIKPLLLTLPTALTIEAFFDLGLSIDEMFSAAASTVGQAGRLAAAMTPFVAFFCITGTHPGTVFWPVALVVLMTTVLSLRRTLAESASVRAMSAAERRRLLPMALGWAAVLGLFGLSEMILAIQSLHTVIP